MARARSRPRALTALEWVAVLVLGGLLGSGLAALARALLGDGPIVAFLARTWRVGLAPPATLDLRVLSLTFGATIDVGLLTAVGAGLALWLYLRLR
jgi:hypothetical protein